MYFAATVWVQACRSGEARRSDQHPVTRCLGQYRELATAVLTKDAWELEIQGRERQTKPRYDEHGKFNVVVRGVSLASAFGGLDITSIDGIERVEQLVGGKPPRESRSSATLRIL